MGACGKAYITKYGILAIIKCDSGAFVPLPPSPVITVVGHNGACLLRSHTGDNCKRQLPQLQPDDSDMMKACEMQNGNLPRCTVRFKGWGRDTESTCYNSAGVPKNKETIYLAVSHSLKVYKAPV